MKRMLPVWLQYPEVEMDSPAWRMGYAEEYLERFHEWYKQLTLEEKHRYDAAFPTPILWNGYHKSEKPCAKLQVNGYKVPVWRNRGMPKYSKKQLLNPDEHHELLLFWGHHPASDGSIIKSCLSQWWQSSFESYGIRYSCCEQYMMVQKARVFGDTQAFDQIMACDDPAQMKRLGRQVRKFDAQIWDRVKYSIVLNGNWKKFSQNPELRQFLLSTRDCVLVEASPYDTVWGIGLSSEQSQSQDPNQWRGENLLGFALMEVRDELTRVYANANILDEK